MAELTEVFEDVADNTKKLVKSKPFLLAILGVAGVALYIGLTRNKTENEEATAYGAVGYAGYPVTGGGGGAEYVGSSDSDYLAAVEDVVNSNNAYYESILNTTTVEQNEQITTLSNRLTTTEETITKQQQELEYKNAISQMQANSNLYNTITDRATKDALHAENLAIAEKYGLTFDKTTGNYMTSTGSVAYTTAKQDAAARGVSTTTTTTKTAAPANTNYTNNATYTAAKQTAATSGSTATTPKQTTSTTKQTTSINAGLSGGKTGAGTVGGGNGKVATTTASGLVIYSSDGSSSGSTKKTNTGRTATAGKLI